MTAVAIQAPSPSRLGMKLFAGVLTVVCTVQILLAFEEVRTVAALRAVQSGAPATGLSDWFGRTWSEAVSAVTPAAPILADSADAVLEGEFAPADEATSAAVREVSFVNADLTIDGVLFETTPFRIVSASETFARDQTFTDAWRAAPDAQIELRRIVGEAPILAACGEAAPGLLALLHRRDRLDLMLFQAAAVPGPDLDPSAVCARWTLEAR